MRAHGYVEGRVQGVFFRASTREKAQELGVTGWVKNLSDGRVEFKAEGNREALEALVEWVHHGPERARVEHVEVEYADDEHGHEKFEIVR